jgi:hypothetical protein
LCVVIYRNNYRIDQCCYGFFKGYEEFDLDSKFWRIFLIPTPVGDLWNDYKDEYITGRFDVTSSLGTVQISWTGDSGETWTYNYDAQTGWANFLKAEKNGEVIFEVRATDYSPGIGGGSIPSYDVSIILAVVGLTVSLLISRMKRTHCCH